MLDLERTASVDDAGLYSAVSNTLWLQRELLETLLYRLVGEQLVLRSGSTRWLAKADDDVRRALDDLRAGEVARAIQVESLTGPLGFDHEPSLAELSAIAAGVWGDILAEHRVALRELAFEVQSVADENQRLLRAGVTAVQETLTSVSRAVRRYDASGSPVHAQPGALLLDEQA